MYGTAYDKDFWLSVHKADQEHKRKYGFGHFDADPYDVDDDDGDEDDDSEDEEWDD